MDSPNPQDNKLLTPTQQPPLLKHLSTRAKINLGIIIASIITIPIILYSQIYSVLDNRSQGLTSDGPASIQLLSNSTSLPLNQLATIQIVTNTQTSLVDGFQTVIDLSGTPVTNLTLTSNNITGLTSVTSSTTPTSTTLAFITQNPTKPYTTNNQPLVLATLSFTPTTAGTLTLTPNPSISKIIETKTGKNLLKTPASYTFNLGSTTSPPQDISAAESACKASGGRWRQFTSSCADTCSKLTTNSSCKFSMTQSCDCGSTACWNGTTCAPNPLKPPTPVKKSFLTRIVETLKNLLRIK